MVRETRRERDGFLARLHGRSPADRQRIAAEHKAYLDGDRATDADFGDEGVSVGSGTEVEMTQRAVQAKKPVYLPPPRGKDASYLAAATTKMENRLAAEAAATKSGAAGKKGRGKAKASSSRPVTKKQAAEKAMSAKIAKEAMARAEDATSAATQRRRENAQEWRLKNAVVLIRASKLSPTFRLRGSARRRLQAKGKQRKKTSPPRS
ncbi:hypothetical protein PHYPSEUDO_012692 [Phytophthora pseudosyringae]|uniref:Uncharacterized protein n=1 Tax=Phytophthora pseudosyringae TaxID=221518 RepID=A0A8T1VB90_9STRA|nr:hypothetical protein PHYPSEUDO_012692 [Phytophthora pseudosyringae]